VKRCFLSFSGRYAAAASRSYRSSVALRSSPPGLKPGRSSRYPPAPACAGDGARQQRASLRIGGNLLCTIASDVSDRHQLATAAGLDQLPVAADIGRESPAGRWPSLPGRYSRRPRPAMAAQKQSQPAQDLRPRPRAAPGKPGQASPNPARNRAVALRPATRSGPIADHHQSASRLRRSGNASSVRMKAWANCCSGSLTTCMRPTVPTRPAGRGPANGAAGDRRTRPPRRTEAPRVNPRCKSAPPSSGENADSSRSDNASRSRDRRYVMRHERAVAAPAATDTSCWRPSRSPTSRPVLPVNAPPPNTRRPRRNGPPSSAARLRRVCTIAGRRFRNKLKEARVEPQRVPWRFYSSRRNPTSSHARYVAGNR
jgi:hypothetical protein